MEQIKLTGENIHLNLFKGYFLMILSGYKPVEYRKVTPYWCSRILLIYGKRKPLKWWKDFFLIHRRRYMKELNVVLKNGVATYRNYTTITFANGYSKNRPLFKINCHSIDIGKGSESLGAEPGIEYFRFKLGKITYRENIISHPIIKELK